MQNILYLGSESPARQQLLRFAQIPFQVISHKSDEQLTVKPTDFADHVQKIAQDKMRSLRLPTHEEVGKDYLFALTADSLIRNPRTHEILGKPAHKDDAKRMLSLECEGVIEVMTGVCLEKFLYHENSWQCDHRRHWTSSAIIEFYVDAESVEQYLTRLPIALRCAGAGVIEDHGLSYLKSIKGSYTAAIGLPLYELRQHLKDLEFIFST